VFPRFVPALRGGGVVGVTLTQGFVRRGGLHPRAILAFSLSGEGMDPGCRRLASAVSHPATC